MMHSIHSVLILVCSELKDHFFIRRVSLYEWWNVKLKKYDVDERFFLVSYLRGYVPYIFLSRFPDGAPWQFLRLAVFHEKGRSEYLSEARRDRIKNILFDYFYVFAQEIWKNRIYIVVYMVKTKRKVYFAWWFFLIVRTES